MIRIRIKIRINNESRETYNTECQINYKPTMIKVYDYSDIYFCKKIIGHGSDTK